MNNMLKDKIYLSKLSIVKYRDYYIEILRNVEFVIADYLEDNLTDYQNVILSAPGKKECATIYTTVSAIDFNHYVDECNRLSSVSLCNFS